VKEAVKNASKDDRPLRLYMCTRKPPPSGELDRFVETHREPAVSGSEVSPTRAVNHVLLRHLPLDLLDPFSIRNCASKFLAQEARLDVLVLNAAIAPNQREPSGQMVRSLQSTMSDQSLDEDLELEQAMMTNVVGSSMLMRLLQPALLKAADDSGEGGKKPRVALVSSELHRRLGDIEGNMFRSTPKSYRRLNWPLQ
jgi:NAD(P)-dependent dehydrogenase (short-subunit alcohol dehydrogenase family)